MRNFKSVLAPVKKQIKGLQKVVLPALRQAVTENQDELVRGNVDTMFAGFRSDGTRISPPYSSLTEEIKLAKGQPVDRVTLRDTGDFHKSVKLKIRARNFEFFATDVKTESLQFRYGDLILGLSERTFERVRAQMVRSVISTLRQRLDFRKGK